MPVSPPSVEREHSHIRRQYWPPWLATEETDVEVSHCQQLRKHSRNKQLRREATYENHTFNPGTRLVS